MSVSTETFNFPQKLLRKEAVEAVEGITTQKYAF